MRLKNKKTGEIAVIAIDPNHSRFTVVGKNSYLYDSLAELNEEWEDYEEPKEYWWIDTGSIPMVRKSNNPILSTAEDIDKAIGNYFETREEAEKAVEKLKAWQRLKDKGFRFDGYDSGHNSNKELCGRAYFKAGNFWFDIKSDLDLLFGGEE